MQRENITVGTIVKAFHPREFGVVRDGMVVKVGRKYAHIDFGSLRGGVFRVPFHHVCGEAL